MMSWILDLKNAQQPAAPGRNRQPKSPTNLQPAELQESPERTEIEHSLIEVHDIVL